jgi:parallel beta-helix repeat protein
MMPIHNLVVGNYEGGIYITGDGNTYGRNTVRDNFGESLAGVSPCDNVQVCDTGTGNTSFGDNLAPGGC